MYVFHLAIPGEMYWNLAFLPFRWLLPDFVSVDKRSGIGLLTDALRCQPHNTRWMSPAERRLVQVRLAEDVGEADQDSAEARRVSDLTTSLLVV